MEIKVLKKVLAAQEEDAKKNVDFFNEKKVVAINLMSSPGSGKTTLIDKTLEALAGEMGFAVVEGDIETTMDAERLAKHDVQITQINTEPFGGDCHLEAGWIRSAAESFDFSRIDVLFVENVGNLVCPAEFELGVDANVVLLSVTEGEDKPAKYPLMFRVSQLCLVTKTDLLPFLDVDMALLEKNVSKSNPQLKMLELSSKTGDGFAEWLDYLRAKVAEKKS
ncbi:MAG TPA: hydrogenase nickel incorporation protein HypB [bacterium]|nr:hydrogenase nickel incorporation protein HypB [bacterium]